MKKHCVLIVISQLLLIASFSGCMQSDTEREKFFGIWITEPKQNPVGGTNYTETRIFYANGSYVTTHMGLGHIPGTWRLSDGNLIIDTYFPGSYQYTFSQNNSVLTLISNAGGFTENLTRQ